MSKIFEMPEVETKLVAPIINSTVYVIKTQCFSNASCHKVPAVQVLNKIPLDVISIIAVKNKVMSGMISLCFPSATFLQLMSTMLGENYQHLTKEIEEGAAELLNIIFGQAKVTWNENGYGIEMAIPKVMSKSEIKDFQKKMKSSTVYLFNSDKGPFLIEINMNPKHQLN